MRLQIFNGRLPPEQSPDRHETLGKRVSDDPRHFIFRPQKRQKKNCKTLNGRLPPKDGSVRPQTLGKRVSDDPRHFIFRRREKKINKIFDKNFRLKNSPKNCFRKLPVLEERRYFGPHQQIRLEK